jgi:hypothetical protein
MGTTATAVEEIRRDPSSGKRTSVKPSSVVDDL